MPESSKRQILHTASLDFDLVSAQDQVEKTVAISGVNVGDIAYVSAPNLDSGLVATAYVSDVHEVTVRVTNVTVADIDSGATHEVQNITHDHTGGTFTISFNGEGPTGNIAYNDDGSGIKTALELFTGITTVTVTENGTGDWDIEFDDPGLGDLPLMTVNGAGLTGGTEILVTEVTKGVTGAQNVYLAIVH